MEFGNAELEFHSEKRVDWCFGHGGLGAFLESCAASHLFRDKVILKDPKIEAFSLGVAPQLIE